MNLSIFCCFFSSLRGIIIAHRIKVDCYAGANHTYINNKKWIDLIPRKTLKHGQENWDAVPVSIELKVEHETNQKPLLWNHKTEHGERR